MAYNTFNTSGIQKSNLKKPKKVSISNNINNKNQQYNFDKNEINNQEINYEKTINNTISYNKNINNDKKTNYGNIDYSNIFTEGYTPQGYTVINGDVYITAYKSGSRSRIYVYDGTTGKNKSTVTLNYKSHVGGITYDPAHNLMIITEYDGNVLFYDYDRFNKEINEKGAHGYLEIKDTKDEDDYLLLKTIDVVDGDKNAASIYYKNGKIYAPTYYGDKKGTMSVYTVDRHTEIVDDPYNKEMVLVTDKNSYYNKHYELCAVKRYVDTLDFKEEYIAECPIGTQGVAIAEYNGQKYILFSTSSGLSEILVYVLNDDGSMTYRGVKYAEPATEGIYVDEDNKISYITEFKLDGNIHVQENFTDFLFSLDYFDKDFVQFFVRKKGVEIKDEGVGGAWRWRYISPIPGLIIDTIQGNTQKDIEYVEDYAIRDLEVLTRANTSRNARNIVLH